MITMLSLILAVILNFISDVKGFAYGIKIKSLIKEALIIDVILLLFFMAEGVLKQ